MSPLDLGVWGDLAAAVRLQLYDELCNITLQSLMNANLSQQKYGLAMRTASSRRFL